MALHNLVERVSFRDSDHTYHLDGKKVPSVTTVLGNLSKPGLTWWAAKEGAKAVRQWWEDNATKKPGEDGRYVGVDEHDIDHLYELARLAHSKRVGTAAAKGNVVHGAIDRFHANFWEAEPPAKDTPARAAWDAFIAWWSTAGLRCISTERKIVDPEQRYAGRLDMLCEHDDDACKCGANQPEAMGLLDTPFTCKCPEPDLYVCDIKTSNGVYPEMLYQNAGYAAAIEAELGRKVAGTKVLWLPEGCTKLTVVERDNAEWRGDFAVFETLIPLHAHRAGLDKWLQDVKETHGPKEAPTE